MKESRFSEEQISAMLKEGSAGANIAESCSPHGISKECYYLCCAKTSSGCINPSRINSCLPPAF